MVLERWRGRKGRKEKEAELEKARQELARLNNGKNSTLEDVALNVTDPETTLRPDLDLRKLDEVVTPIPDGINTSIPAVKVDAKVKKDKKPKKDKTPKIKPVAQGPVETEESIREKIKAINLENEAELQNLDPDEAVKAIDKQIALISKSNLPKKEKETEIASLTNLRDGFSKKISTPEPAPSTTETAKAEKEVEKLSTKEQWTLRNFGLRMSQKKNEALAWVLGKASRENEVGKVEENSVRRFTGALAKIFTRNAEEMREKSLEVQKGNKGALKGWAGLGADVVRYGRVIADWTGRTTAVPTRYLMMLSMAAEKGFEAGKEAKLGNEALLKEVRKEKRETMSQDEMNRVIAEAQEEAFAMNPNAKKALEEGEDPSKMSQRELKDAYLKALPQELKKRMVAPEAAWYTVQGQAQRDIASVVAKMEKKMAEIEASNLPPEKKKEQEIALLRKFEKKLTDWDRMITSAGIVNEFAYGLSKSEKGAKILTQALTIETLLVSAEKLAERIWDVKFGIVDTEKKLVNDILRGNIIKAWLEAKGENPSAANDIKSALEDASPAQTETTNAFTKGHMSGGPGMAGSQVYEGGRGGGPGPRGSLPKTENASLLSRSAEPDFEMNAENEAMVRKMLEENRLASSTPKPLPVSATPDFSILNTTPNVPLGAPPALDAVDAARAAVVAKIEGGPVEGVTFDNGKGGIQGVIDLRRQIFEKYNGNYSGLPQSVQDFMKEPNATKLAMKLGLFDPTRADGKESAMILKGAVLKFDNDGNLMFGKPDADGKIPVLEKYSGTMFDSDKSGAPGQKVGTRTTTETGATTRKPWDPSEELEEHMRSKAPANLPISNNFNPNVAGIEGIKLTEPPTSGPRYSTEIAPEADRYVPDTTEGNPQEAPRTRGVSMGETPESSIAGRVTEYGAEQNKWNTPEDMARLRAADMHRASAGYSPYGSSGGGWGDYFGWGRYTDTAKIEFENMTQELRLPSEFDKNYEMLSSEAMADVRDLHYQNIDNIFGRSIAWGMVKDKDVGPFLKGDPKVIGNNPQLAKLHEYLTKLQETTGVKSRGGLFRKGEKVGEYIARALQKAEREGFLGSLNLKYNGTK